MAIVYSKKMLIERIKRHIANGFPNASFAALDSEILLYIDQALAYGLVGQVYAAAKVEGNIAMPEGYLTTYLLPALQKDHVTQEWYTTLPQPPVSLPLGYSIDRLYFADSANGTGQQIPLIKAKRVGFRSQLPRSPNGTAHVEGSKLVLDSNGVNMSGTNLYVRMASTRTADVTATINMPDDAIEMVFNNVVSKLVQRMQLPKDVIADDLGSGNKSS